MMILPRLSDSSPVSILVEPNIPSSIVSLSSVRELQLLPLFDRFCRYTRRNPVRSHTERLLHTAKLSLACAHSPSAGGVVLGSDWVSACSAVFREDESGLEDPSRATVSSLPDGHYWSANDGVPYLLMTHLLTNGYLRLR